jgi:arylsulfatase A-like enzyme
MVTSVDDQVGRIVAALDKRGLRQNTLIIFSSDNGGPRSAVVASGAHSPQERAESGVVQSSLPASNGTCGAARAASMKAVCVCQRSSTGQAP